MTPSRTGSAEVTWMRIREKTEDDDDDRVSYRATGRIDGKISVPDCDPQQVTLPSQINNTSGWARSGPAG